MRSRFLLASALAVVCRSLVACGGGGGAAEPDTGAFDSGAFDSGARDSGTDAVVDTAPDTTPILPEGGVATAPIAGAVVAHDARYTLVMSTGQGGAKGPMTSGRYDLRGAKIAVTVK